MIPWTSKVSAVFGKYKKFYILEILSGSWHTPLQMASCPHWCFISHSFQDIKLLGAFKWIIKLTKDVEIIPDEDSFSSFAAYYIPDVCLLVRWRQIQKISILPLKCQVNSKITTSYISQIHFVWITWGLWEHTSNLISIKLYLVLLF